MNIEDFKEAQANGFRVQHIATNRGFWHDDNWQFDGHPDNYRIHPDDVLMYQKWKARKEKAMMNDIPNDADGVRKRIEVMKAYCEGKKIQCRARVRGAYVLASRPVWDWHGYDYRIAPEVKTVRKSFEGKMVDLNVTIENGEIVKIELKKE